MPRYLVRSRETRVYEWEIEANNAEKAAQIVEDYLGDTEKAKNGDQFDSAEIMDVEEI